MSQPSAHLRESYGVIPHPAEPRVLMKEGREGWDLPLHSPGSGFYAEVRQFNRTMQQLTGLHVTTLRWINLWRDPETKNVQRVYAMENHSSIAEAPAGWTWITREQLSELQLANPRLRPILVEWFDQASAPVPALRAPWATPGWHGEVSAWVDLQTRAIGLTPTGPLEQVKTWQITAVMRQETDGGPVWFKATPPLFGREAAVTFDLAKRFPAATPEVVAVDLERRWLLMRDFGGALLNEVKELGRWEAALRLYAQIQVDYASRVTELPALGCLDRSLPVLEASLDHLLEECRPRLAPEYAAKLEQATPAIRQLFAELAAYRVPVTLEHGDLHPRNIMVKENGQAVIFDWTDGTIAHPFLSATTFFGPFDREQPFMEIADARERLIHAYLEPFTVYEPMDRLRRAFDLGEKLGILHQVYSYQLLILPAVELKEEWQDVAPDWLSDLLKQL